MNKKLSLIILTLFFSIFAINAIDTTGSNQLIMVGDVGTSSLSSSVAQTAWTTNGTVVCNVSYDKDQPRICNDGAGGAIITWADDRFGTYDIYAQRISSSGVALWPLQGVGVCTLPFDQRYPEIVSDGAGGAIIVWQDRRSGNIDLYAQRLSSSGAPQWSAGGVAIVTLSGPQDNQSICTDGSEGAFIVWNDDYDIYAHRIYSDGVVNGTAGGETVCDEAQWQRDFDICNNGLGSAVVVWEDLRSPPGEIWAQKLNSTAGGDWATNGVPVYIASSDSNNPKVCSDGAGGAIITWYEAAVDYDIYAQRLNSAGARPWGTSGVGICTRVNDTWHPVICSDESGGAIIAWYDQYGCVSGQYDIYAQRISPSGITLWTTNGSAICTATGRQYLPEICSDGKGGAFITWEYYSVEDIYVQHVSSGGTVQWTQSGSGICIQSNDQTNPQICSDGNYGALIVWHDNRTGGVLNIYAQKIIGEPPEEVNLLLLAMAAMVPSGGGFLGLSIEMWLIIGGAAVVAIIIIVIVAKKK